MNRNRILIIPQVTTVALSIAFPPQAFALMNQSGNSNAVNPSQLDSAKQGCGSVCDLILDDDAEIRGVTGASGWNTADDQWCATHGSQTEATIGANAGSEPRVQVAGCSHPIFQSDIARAKSQPGITIEQAACREVSQKLLRCTYRHSEVEIKCMAYKQNRDTSKLENWLIGFDTVAAASCGTACAAMLVNPAGAGTVLTKACKYAGMVAVGSEAAGALFIDQGPVGRMLGGVVGGVGGAHYWGGKSKDSKVTDDVAEKTAEKKDNKGHVCAAAAIFATMAGLRASSSIGAKRTAKKSCQDVEKLVSDAAIYNPGLTGPYTGNSNTGPIDRSGRGGAGGNGARTKTNLADAGGNDAVADGAPTLPPEYRAALDGEMLTRSGLDRFASEKLNAEAVEQMAKDFENGSGLSSTLGSMGESLGSLGGALTGLAQTAYQNAASVKLPGVTGTAYASLGGGAKSPASASDTGGMPDFGNLFGGKGDPAAAGGSGSLSFNQRPESTDIWHADSNENIFQIVSGRIERVTPRIAPR